MKFFPPENQPIQIALTSGHIAVVEPTGTDIHKIFHKQAIALGCLPEGVERDTPADTKPFDKASAIIEAMYKMVDDADESEFTGDGKPDVRALSKRVGFAVTRDERDSAWEAVGDDSAAE